jgi:hypothetical protein
MGLFLVTMGIFGIAIAALSVGVVFSKEKELKGSCGGPEVNADCCQTCPDKDACDDVKGLELDVPHVHAKREVPGLAQAL